MQKNRRYIPAKIIDRSKLGVLSYEIYPSFFFLFFQILFRFFLGPLNMLSKSFRAKIPPLHSEQNSLPIWPLGIFVRKLTEFFFFFKEFPISFPGFYKCYPQLFMQKNRRYIPAKIIDRSKLGVLSYEIYPSFFFFVFSNTFSFLSWTFEYAI